MGVEVVIVELMVMLEIMTRVIVGLLGVVE